MQPVPPSVIAQLDTIGQRALSHRVTLDYSYRLTADALARGVWGAIAECGVFAGAQAAAMALASLHHGQPRTVHLFDSFQGIPEAGPRDDRTITDLVGVGQGRLVSTGQSVCSAAAVRQHFAEWGLGDYPFAFHPGWFQDTVPDAADALSPPRPRTPYTKGLAVLRLDGDLYESTRVCLEHLAPLVNPGGVIIIDDYALTGCRAACEEYWARVGRPLLVPIPGGGGPVYYVV